MKTLSIRELREALSSLEDTLKKEGGLLITRRGKVVARILAAPAESTVPSLRGLRALITRPEVKSATLVREDRDAR